MPSQFATWPRLLRTSTPGSIGVQARVSVADGCEAESAGLSLAAADSWLRSTQWRLPEAHRTYTPAFLAASASHAGWRPAISGVRAEGELIGLFYAREKTLGGIGTGLIYADAVLGGMIAAEPVHQERVFSCALTEMLQRPSVRGLRICVPPDGYERRVVERLASSLPVRVSFRPLQYHSAIPLSATFAEFLNSLGRHTRRNLRYYRRRFEATHGAFVSAMNFAEFEQAAEVLLCKKVVGASHSALRRTLAVLSAVSRPLLAGLRSRDGDWMAVIGGWHAGTSAVVFAQMNDDRDHTDMSLGLVLRSYLIEAMTVAGMHEVVFWAGAGGLLAKHAIPLPTTAVYLDKQLPGWRLFQCTLAALQNYLPETVRQKSVWVLPSLGFKQ